MRSCNGISRVESNDNRLRLLGKVERMVFYSDSKHLEQYVISNCKYCYLCPCSREARPFSNSFIPGNISSLIGPLSQTELAERLQERKGFLVRTIGISV